MSNHCLTRRALARLAASCLALGAAAPARAQQSGPAPQPLTLKQAVQLALDQGLQAQAAEATRDAARYQHGAFTAGLLPQLSVGGDVPAYNRSIIQVLQPDGSTLFRAQDQTSTGLNATLSQILPVTGGRLFVSSALTRLALSGPQGVETWSSTPLAIGLSQPILRPNASGWDRREQSITAELREREYLEARETIALETVAVFCDVYAAQTALETATINAAVNDTLYTLNQGRLEIGKIGENDLLQSQLALLRSRTRVDGAKLDYQRALAALRLAVHLPPGTPIQVAVPADIPGFAPDTGVAVRQALANRATVTSARLQDIQARRRVTEAKLSGWLGATLNATYGFNATASEVSQAYRNLLEARTLRLSVSLPLWQWGAHGAGVGAAQADRDAAERKAEATLDQTAFEAQFAALGLSQARRNLALSATADTVAGKRFEVAYNRYLIGKITLDNLYIAQQEQDQARTGYVQALRSFWQAYYELRRTTLFDFERGEVIR
jgi:outer membrane protein TolC